MPIGIRSIQVGIWHIPVGISDIPVRIWLYLISVTNLTEIDIDAR